MLHRYGLGDNGDVDGGGGWGEGSEGILDGLNAATTQQKRMVSTAYGENEARGSNLPQCMLVTKTVVVISLDSGSMLVDRRSRRRGGSWREDARRRLDIELFMIYRFVRKNVGIWRRECGGTGGERELRWSISRQSIPCY